RNISTRCYSHLYNEWKSGICRCASLYNCSKFWIEKFHYSFRQGFFSQRCQTTRIRSKEIIKFLQGVSKSDQLFICHTTDSLFRFEFSKLTEFFCGCRPNSLESSC